MNVLWKYKSRIRSNCNDIKVFDSGGLEMTENHNRLEEHLLAWKRFTNDKIEALARIWLFVFLWSFEKLSSKTIKSKFLVHLDV